MDIYIKDCSIEYLCLENYIYVYIKDFSIKYLYVKNYIYIKDFGIKDFKKLVIKYICI